MLNFNKIKSIVIIGASEDPKKIGNILIQKNHNFDGKIYGINPKGGSYNGINFHTEISKLPEVPDIAIFAIPESYIYQSLEECGKFGIKKAIIITAGFKEIGNIEGEKRIQEIAQRYNIRFLGPNCLGYGNTHQKLNLSFGSQYFDTGNIGIISQSGAIAVAITDILASRKLGFSSFFSLGNKTNIDESDLIEEFLHDSNTDVVGIYLESINQGYRFISLLQKITKIKPVIIMIGGVSNKGKVATASHTGSLSGDKNMYESALKQGGATLTYSIAEFFDYIEIFSINAKKRINGNPLIITNAGGIGVLATDQFEFSNLELKTINKNEDTILRKLMPTMMSTKNPIDIIGDADSDRVRQILDNILQLESKSDLIFLFTIQATTDIENICHIIIDFYSKYPEYAIFVGLIGGDTVVHARELLNAKGIFTSGTTEGMANAYQKLHTFHIPKTSSNPQEKIYKKPRKESKILDQNETEKILRKHHIQTTHTHEFNNLESIIEYSKTIPSPYIMKIGGKTIAHKTELNGVSGKIYSIEDMSNTYNSLIKNAEKYENYEKIVTVGRFIESSPKIELFFGAKRDPIFGNTYMIGSGGIFLSILDDTQLHIGNWENNTIQDTIKELRCYPALVGFRGQEGVNIDLLIKSIKNLTQLFEENSDIAEIDINPILFENGKPIIADAKLYLN